MNDKLCYTSKMSDLTPKKTRRSQEFPWFPWVTSGWGWESQIKQLHWNFLAYKDQRGHAVGGVVQSIDSSLVSLNRLTKLKIPELRSSGFWLLKTITLSGYGIYLGMWQSSGRRNYCPILVHGYQGFIKDPHSFLRETSCIILGTVLYILPSAKKDEALRELYDMFSKYENTNPLLLLLYSAGSQNISTQIWTVYYFSNLRSKYIGPLLQ